MKAAIKVPQAGESVTEAMISDWFKEDGDFVEVDESILELETDKANMELPAEQAGILKILVPAGEMVKVGQTIGEIEVAEGASASSADAEDKDTEVTADSKADIGSSEKILSPAARRIATEENLDPAKIKGTGKDGRVLKEDAAAAAKGESTPAKPAAEKAPAAKPAPQMEMPKPKTTGSREERTVPMSLMRRKIAERLVDAQHTAAILTTFNEVDMSAVMDLRDKYKDSFQKKHGVKLGFMSFFVKACIEALQHIPEINAQIDGNNIIYRDYYDVGVAVGTAKGLVVPVIRDADKLSFAQLEQAILAYAYKARDNKIGLDDLTGGTFTISNGGTYGSLLSTPILNPPQSGILGMHKIEKRPIVVDDQIVIRPMMYLALSYDHRIVDGKGAVTFLVKVKECLEDPARMLLEI